MPTYRLGVVLLVAWAFEAAACGGSSPAPGGPLPAVSGEQAFRTRTCRRCHARDRSGTEIGPPLRGLSRDWDVDSLSRYIDDPAPFRAHDPRLAALVTLYRGRLMKGFAMQPEERRALAAWLLEDPP